MFCSRCGSEASGNFCSKCGAALATPPASTTTAGAASAGIQEADDWQNEVRYDVLMRRPEVREMIARQAAVSPKHASAEDFLASADKWLKPQVPLEMISEVLVPL